MSYPIVTGTVLVEANGAALNNGGQEPGARVDNAIVVKQIRVGRLRYPYVSGQAWRRWWREVLYEDFGWQRSPITTIKKPQQAFTAGDPITFEEDDIFGYMVARKRAQKGKKGTEPEENGEAASQAGTYRRISPLKNSLLVSVLANVIDRDFGHFTRNLPVDADPLLFEAEHYTTYLNGVFTISLSDVGRFEVGEMRDLPEEAVKNKQDLTNEGERGYVLSQEKRIKRVKDVIDALSRLRGGARLARNLSDVTPVAVLIGFLDGGNAPFQRLFEADANNERVVLNLSRLRSVLSDYQERLLKPEEGKAVYLGYYPSVLANEAEVAQALETDEVLKATVALVKTPKDALDKAAAAVNQVFTKHSL